jgi:hypothetical protein
MGNNIGGGERLGIYNRAYATVVSWRGMLPAPEADV